MKQFRPLKKKDYAIHIIIYSWAMQYCGGANVMDIGCGEGYGLIPISLVAKSIIGVDRECNEMGKPVLRICLANKYFCPARFIIKDLEKERIGEKRDVCLAFDILEHLENPEFVLEEISKQCKTFIFSVPRKAIVHYHKQCFMTKEDVEKLISPFFNKIEWFYMRKNFISKVPYTVPHEFIGIARNI